MKAIRQCKTTPYTNVNLTILASPLLHIIVILILIFGCQPVSVDQRIENIENGLLKAITIEGQPVEKLHLSDRMDDYHVPGVSIAIINDF